MNEISLHGELGPDWAEPLRKKLDWLLRQPRPHVEVDLGEVTALHLSIVNVLVAGRNEARARLGDLHVVVSDDSEAHYLLAQVGIVGMMRP